MRVEFNLKPIPSGRVAVVSWFFLLRKDFCVVEFVGCGLWALLPINLGVISMKVELEDAAKLKESNNEGDTAKKFNQFSVSAPQS